MARKYKILLKVLDIFGKKAIISSKSFPMAGVSKKIAYV